MTHGSETSPSHPVPDQAGGSMATSGNDPVVWGSRPCGPEDHETILRFFDEPDFYFRTPVPDTLPQYEVLALLTDDTRLITASGEPAGLLGHEYVAAEHACHVRLHLRLVRDVPRHWWRAAYEEAIAALRWRTEVVTLTALAGEFDPLGLAVLRDGLGFDDRGCLTRTLLHRGRRTGYHYFSRHWADAS